MKRNYWIILAVSALVAMFFVPRAAYSLELVPMRAVKAPVTPTQLPSLPAVLPNGPSMPNKPVPGPFEGGKPVIRLPDVVVPMLPFKINVAPAAAIRPQLNIPAVPKVLTEAARSEQGVTQVALDATFDNDARQPEEGATVVVVEKKKEKKSRASRLTLPESDLELEIGIIQ